MSKRFVTLMICLIISAGIYSQMIDLKEGNLQGKVKNVKTNHFKPVVVKDSISATTPPDNDRFWSNGYIDDYYIFDKNGNTIEYHAYNTDGADDNKTINIFNQKGLLRDQRTYADNEYLGKITFMYDTLGRVTQVRRYDEKGILTDRIYHIRDPKTPLPKTSGEHNNIWVYKYNDNKQCIEEKCLFPDGKLSFRQIFFYDENGRQSQMITFDSNNVQYVITSYEYDSSGNICSMRRITPTRHTSMKFSFDKFGNEVYSYTKETTITYKLEPEKMTQTVTETASNYKYDKNNNWIYKVYYMNNTPLYIQKRLINYYPAISNKVAAK